MSEWIATELAESQMHDRRHAKRLAHLLERLSEQAASSIPRACHGWAETMAAYRFLDNSSVGFAEILSGHKQATVERLQAQEVILSVQDTTFLNYGTLYPKEGVGTVKDRPREEYLLYLSVAFTPERVNLGVLGLRMWQRPEEPIAHERARKPIEEKESYRWVEGYQLACEVQQHCPTTLVVTVIYAKERRPPKGEEPVEWLLLTSLLVKDFASACTVVQWYRARWESELFFRVLKQGCQIERLRVATAPRLLNALAIYLIIAWRIHTITMMGRVYPEASGEAVFEPQEWQAIYNAVSPSPATGVASPTRDSTLPGPSWWLLSAQRGW